MKNTKKDRNIDFLFEASALKRLLRTGWQILGTNRESVAEHSFMVCVISYVIAKEEKTDITDTLLTALFHDFSEARTGDVFRLADLYTEADEKKAEKEVFSAGKHEEIVILLDKFRKNKTREAEIVHDADTLALCIELKQSIEHGNINAQEWMDSNLKKLKLRSSQKLGKKLKTTNSQNWWKKEREKLHRLR